MTRGRKMGCHGLPGRVRHADPVQQDQRSTATRLRVMPRRSIPGAVRFPHLPFMPRRRTRRDKCDLLYCSFILDRPLRREGGAVI
jgi:hypothetical protein